jgi:hypothetical protein
MKRDEQELGELLAAYRAACQAPEPGADFMPGIWSRIDSRRRFTVMLRRLTSAFVTAAAVICITIAVYTGVPVPAEQPYYSTTYVETLAQDETFETLAFAEFVNNDLSGNLEVR